MLTSSVETVRTTSSEEGLRASRPSVRVLTQTLSSKGTYAHPEARGTVAVLSTAKKVVEKTSTTTSLLILLLLLTRQVPSVHGSHDRLFDVRCLHNPDPLVSLCMRDAHNSSCGLQ